ncbi:MAG: hypothetical protein ACI4XW_00970 [Candidatus Spyradocola sp.]
MTPKKDTPYIGYEYKEATVPAQQASMYMDCYACFGWEPDGNMAAIQGRSSTTLRMKRNRNLINRMELTRLQQHFEACAHEIDALSASRTCSATAWSLTVGVLGTAFMAGSTFAVVHEPPIVWLCVLLAIPGFLGWLLPPFVHQRIARQKTRQLQPMIEAKQEEINKICEKGHSLL